MQYDPIKRSLGKVFNTQPWLRKIFYRLLDILLLRAWHIKKQLKVWAGENRGKIQVLDAGSGFGQYSYFMTSHFPDWNITSVDVKEEQIADCSRFFETIGHRQVSFQVADLEQYKLENTFQLILSVDVMEHIPDDQKVFDNFFASLCTGGMLLISTPSDLGGSDVHDDEHDSFVDEHVRDGYNRDDIREKLEKSGFSRVEVQYTYGKPGNISWKLSMKYPLVLLNISKLFFILLPVYYILSFPFCLILNAMDVRNHHESGTGLLVKAWK